MAEDVVAAGLVFPAPVVVRIRERIEHEDSLTRSELSREVCEWQGWRSPSGGLREMSCRLGLLELELGAWGRTCATH